MKKLLLGLGLLVALLAACGNNDENKKDSTNENTSEESGETFEVDKGVFNVEVTLPASFFQDETDEEIIAGAKEDGIENITINPDRSVTYKMSKSEHKKVMEEMNADIIETVEEIVHSEEYPSIQEISYSKNFDEFDIKVDREQFDNSFEGFAVFGLVFTSTYYNVFNGTPSENLKLKFNYIDAATNEIYDTSVFPDDFEDEEGQTSESEESQ